MKAPDQFTAERYSEDIIEICKKAIKENDD